MFEATISKPGEEGKETAIGDYVIVAVLVMHPEGNPNHPMIQVSVSSPENEDGTSQIAPLIVMLSAIVRHLQEGMGIKDVLPKLAEVRAAERAAIDAEDEKFFGKGGTIPRA